MADRYLTNQDLDERGLFSRGYRARLEAAGEFPKGRRIGKRRKVWLESEIEEFMASRPLAIEARPDSGGDLPARGHGNI